MAIRFPTKGNRYQAVPVRPASRTLDGEKAASFSKKKLNRHRAFSDTGASRSPTQPWSPGILLARPCVREEPCNDLVSDPSALSFFLLSSPTFTRNRA